MFLDRSKRAGRHLEWKVWLFTAGAVLALVGIYFEERRMTGAAIVVLMAGVLVRFLPGGSDGPEGRGLPEVDADEGAFRDEGDSVV